MKKIFKIHLVAGARPNFMKVAPLYHQLKQESWCEVCLIATGQHYSPELSEVFLREFSLPNPDFYLGAGEGTPEAQLFKIKTEYDKVLSETSPDLVVVVGDVTSTLAGCLAAKKRGVRVAHVEAGLRSGDFSMPEERNRIEVDKVSDLLFAPSQDAVLNLEKEGCDPAAIFMVGNIMIDTYEMLKHKISQLSRQSKLPFSKKQFALVTLHRPSNVDFRERLESIVHSLIESSQRVSLVFPVHPRTLNKLTEFNLIEKLQKNVEKIKLLSPLGYIEFMSYLEQSLCVITDSGGIQEESTYLNIPCLTVRKNSERPITLLQGTNLLVEPEQLPDLLQTMLRKPVISQPPPPLWDGETASRVCQEIKKYFKVS